MKYVLKNENKTQQGCLPQQVAKFNHYLGQFTRGSDKCSVLKQHCM